MKSTFDKKTVRNIFSFILASFTVFSLSLKMQQAVIPETILASGAYDIALFRFIVDLVFSASVPTWYTVFISIAVAYFYKERLFKKRENKDIFLILSVSVIVVFALLLCQSYSLTDSWDLVFGNRILFAKSLLRMIGFVPMAFLIVEYLLNLNLNVTSEGSVVKKPLKMIAINTMLFMVCWIPYFILLYPGCLAPDGFDQLAQALNQKEYCWTIYTIIPADENIILNNHHPVLYTGILKLTTLLAELIGSYEPAFEILCILQSLLLAISFSYMIYVMRKHKASEKFCLFAFLFCAFNPLIPIYGMTIVKDALFCIFFVLTAVQMYEMLMLKKISIMRSVVFLLTLLFLVFTRNNSVYILILIIVCLVFLLFRNKKKMIKIAAMLIIPVIMYQVVFINMICPALGISQSSPREMLSVPFQQTARYIKEHPEDVTEEDEVIISKILFCDGDVDVLAENYDPDIADNIKNRYRKSSTSEDFINYIKVWFKGLVKHPMTYVQAYLNLNYGWLSYEGNDFIAYSAVGPVKVAEMIKEYDGYMGNEMFRAIVNRSLNLLGRFPLTSIFLEMATYTWLYLILLYHIIKRKKKQAFLVCALAFFNYLTCLVGPVAYMRYVIPMVCLAPFAIFIVFKKQKETKNNG